VTDLVVLTVSNDPAANKEIECQVMNPAREQQAVYAKQRLNRRKRTKTTLRRRLATERKY
jgi:hypothetical protein